MKVKMTDKELKKIHDECKALIEKLEKELGVKLTLYKGGDPKTDAMIDLLECKDVGQKI